tara:strand:- start:910 stop:1161 length:252 start_codon:yes stop_codon:yes gene_type:complete
MYLHIDIDIDTDTDVDKDIDIDTDTDTDIDKDIEIRLPPVSSDFVAFAKVSVIPAASRASLYLSTIAAVLRMDSWLIFANPLP